MELITDNWVLLLSALGAILIIFGLIKKLVKLAVFGLGLVAVGFVLFQLFA